MTGPEFEQALLGDAGGITFDPTFSFDAGQEQFRGTGKVQLRGHPDQTREAAEGQHLRTQGRVVGPPFPRRCWTTTTPYSRKDSTFKVQGLSFYELAAEKFLDWCSKDLAKPIVDLAYIAREKPHVATASGAVRLRKCLPDSPAPR